MSSCASSASSCRRPLPLPREGLPRRGGSRPRVFADPDNPGRARSVVTADGDRIAPAFDAGREAFSRVPVREGSATNPGAVLRGGRSGSFGLGRLGLNNRTCRSRRKSRDRGSGGRGGGVLQGFLDRRLSLPWARNEIPLRREGRHDRRRAARGTGRRSGPHGQAGEGDDPEVGGQKRGHECGGGDPDTTREATSGPFSGVFTVDRHVERRLLGPACWRPEKPHDDRYQNTHVPPTKDPSASPQRGWCGGSIGDPGR